MTARTIHGGFGDAEPETHGGARWSIAMAPHAGTPTCAFVELSHGTADYFG